MEAAQPASPRQAAFWKKAVPLGEPKKLLGLGFVLAVAVIWVVASFVVQVRGAAAAGRRLARCSDGGWCIALFLSFEARGSSRCFPIPDVLTPSLACLPAKCRAFRRRARTPRCLA